MYITDLRAISPQATFDAGGLQDHPTSHSGNKYNAQEPDYAGLIAPILLRRMGKSIRMGIGAGLPLIQNQRNIDAIIIGSSEGGLEDCIKFLNQIVLYKEGTLTPTNFVQSTPNALAGSLALMSRNTCYNITHVHKGNAFENALIDAMLLFEEGKADTILAGNVEEISDYNFNIETLAGQFKVEDSTSENLLESGTPGTVCGEGASMFILKDKADDYLARIVDVAQISYPTEEEILGLIMDTLKKNNLRPEDIDTLILGKSGDSHTDVWYTAVNRKLFQEQSIFTFKDLVGEYPTSIAFATYLAACLISGRNIGWKLILPPKPIKHILIYNHYKGVQHGLILMSI